MGSRFAVLSLLTGLFQLVCAAVFVLGLVMIFARFQPGSPNDPVGLLPPAMRIGAGAVIALYGLMGLVFSGGISVLISIDQNTHRLAQELPATLAAVKAQSLAARPQNPPVAPVAHGQAMNTCRDCNATNDPGNRFCDACGHSLAG